VAGETLAASVGYDGGEAGAGVTIEGRGLAIAVSKAA
jgi:hypothetical protein